ncbi:hypothetical protein [Candidatus Contendibacter odensensis]|uniref:SGNH/GDSL hydrolase family protein n=1 Tax=Candidatus Contendobacter odensis Run_B_J11 TaxID=1400861 RepID=A0A7U7GDI9_9GAMM|nr:hypothetical protein [Candidatus Contendobacter odensis]CDH46093.1 hypothetical protein BN874_340053 [Candidatus Contendobacter odensis Run_B_J11]
MIRSLIHSLFGVLLALLAVEAVLRLLPVSTSTKTGYYIHPLILNYPPYHEFIVSTGWNLRNAQRHRANNYGFLTHRDFVPDPQAVALIGDSFVEANMLAEGDRLSGQLQSQLAPRPVFALGEPGTSLLDYAVRARFAREHFGVRDFVFVIERGDVRETLCGSGNIHGPCLDPDTLEPRTELQPPAGLTKRILRESALAQYLFSQIKIDPAALLRPLRTVPLPQINSYRPNGPEDVPLEKVDRIVERFFSSLPRGSGERLLLVFDSDRDHLLETPTIGAPVRNRFMQLAQQTGIEIVDTAPLFRDFLRKTGLSLNVGPFDKHWNREANRLVAEAVAIKIEAIKGASGVVMISHPH